MFQKFKTKQFWLDLGERTLRTFGQGVAAFATGVTLDMVQADIQSVVIGGALAGAYAVLTGLITALRQPQQDNASLLKQPVVTEPGRHDGSQAPYDASSESYGDEQLADAGLPLLTEPTTGPTTPSGSSSANQPMGFVAKPLTGSPFQGPTTRQRGPNGRFLPRNQGDI